MNEQSSADVAQAAVYVYDLDTPDRWHSNQLEQLNQTVNDVEKVLAQNCAVLSQHEERLCSLLQRSEAIEMSARQFECTTKKRQLSRWTRTFRIVAIMAVSFISIVILSLMVSFI